MNLPQPGSMLVIRDEKRGILYAEVTGIRNVGGMSSWGPQKATLYDLKLFFEDEDPEVSQGWEELALEATMEGIEISRQYKNRRSSRIVTFEDGDKFAYQKEFKEW